VVGAKVIGTVLMQPDDRANATPTYRYAPSAKPKEWLPAETPTADAAPSAPASEAAADITVAIDVSEAEPDDVGEPVDVAETVDATESLVESADRAESAEPAPSGASESAAFEPSEPAAVDGAGDSTDSARMVDDDPADDMWSSHRGH
jgi:hypothetical protein